MGRRQFIALIAAILMLFGIRASDAEAAKPLKPNASDDIQYWVVVEGKNPFVFGVKKDSEVRSFKRVRPDRFRSAEAARAAIAA